MINFFLNWNDHIPSGDLDLSISGLLLIISSTSTSAERSMRSSFNTARYEKKTKRLHWGILRILAKNVCAYLVQYPQTLPNQSRYNIS